VLHSRTRDSACSSETENACTYHLTHVPQPQPHTTPVQAYNTASVEERRGKGYYSCCSVVRTGLGTGLRWCRFGPATYNALFPMAQTGEDICDVSTVSKKVEAGALHDSTLCMPGACFPAYMWFSSAGACVQPSPTGCGSMQSSSADRLPRHLSNVQKAGSFLFHGLAVAS
jgi:hypothetical protein